MNWIKKHPLLCAGIILGILFLSYYAYTSIRWIVYPNSTDYGEGFVMNYAKLWASGQWKWNINVPPYLTMVYGVGFPILATPLVNLFGAELWVGRAMSFAASIVIICLVYLIVLKLTRKKSYALISALIPATQPIIRDWGALARVDMIAVMFDLLGFYIVLRFKNTNWLYVAIIPFTIAMMVKLTAVAGLLATIIYLILYNRSAGGLFVASLSSVMVIVISVLISVSGGEYLNHVLLYQNTIMNFNVGTFLFIFQQLIYPLMLMVLLAVLYLKKCWQSSFNLPSLFLISAFIIDILSSFRSGAAGMYYFELIIAVSVCAGLMLSQVRKLATSTYPMLAVFMIFFAITAPFNNMPFPDKQFDVGLEQAKKIMGDSQRIITEIPSVALSMNREIYIEYFVFANLSRLEYWDETNYVNQYRNQYFDYVLLRVPLEKRLEYMTDGQIDGDFTDDAIMAMNDNYRLVFQSVCDYWPNSIYLYKAKNIIR